MCWALISVVPAVSVGSVHANAPKANRERTALMRARSSVMGITRIPLEPAVSTASVNDVTVSVAAVLIAEPALLEATARNGHSSVVP